MVPGARWWTVQLCAASAASIAHRSSSDEADAGAGTANGGGSSCAQPASATMTSAIDTDGRWSARRLTTPRYREVARTREWLNPGIADAPHRRPPVNRARNATTPESRMRAQLTWTALFLLGLGGCSGKGAPGRDGGDRRTCITAGPGPVPPAKP